MTNTEWTSNYPTSLDDSSSLSSLKNEEDTILPSHITAIRNATIELETQIGSDNEETGSLRERVTTLEAAGVSGGIGDVFFEWNGTDLTQFDSLADGTDVTSSSSSVISYAGLNWIKLEITAVSGGYRSETMSVLPISTTPPSANYGVVAECLAETGGQTGMLVAVRYQAIGTLYFREFEDIGGGFPWKQWKAISFTSQTQFGDSLDYPRLSAAYQGVNLGAYVEGESIIRNIEQDRQMQYDNSSPITAIGKAGIGLTTNGTAATKSCYFRNIICFTNLMKGK